MFHVQIQTFGEVIKISKVFQKSEVKQENILANYYLFMLTVTTFHVHIRIEFVKHTHPQLCRKNSSFMHVAW